MNSEILNGIVRVSSELYSFYGKRLSEVQKLVAKETASKSRAHNTIRWLIEQIGGEGFLDALSECGIKVRTSTLNAAGGCTESFSFSAFDFNEVYSHSFEESEFYKCSLPQIIWFFIFQETEDNDPIFIKHFFWQLPEDDYIQAEKVYSMTRARLANGEVFASSSDGRNRYKLPKIKDNPVFHVRNHGRDALQTKRLPVPDKLTGRTDAPQMSFWINATYLTRIIQGKMTPEEKKRFTRKEN